MTVMTIASSHAYRIQLAIVGSNSATVAHATLNAVKRGKYAKQIAWIQTEESTSFAKKNICSERERERQRDRERQRGRKRSRADRQTERERERDDYIKEL